MVGAPFSFKHFHFYYSQLALDAGADMAKIPIFSKPHQV